MENKIVHKFAFCGEMGAGKTTAMEATFHIYRQRYGENKVFGSNLKFAQPMYEAKESLHLEYKPRIFLQKYGDLCRQEFGDDIFERVFEYRYNKILEERIPYIDAQYILFMCDDLRFESEYHLLKKLKFKLIRIDADLEIRKERISDTFLNTTHRSETELNKIVPDVVVINNSGPMDFYKDIEKVV